MSPEASGVRRARKGAALPVIAAGGVVFVLAAGGSRGTPFPPLLYFGVLAAAAYAADRAADSGKLKGRKGWERFLKAFALLMYLAVALTTIGTFLGSAGTALGRAGADVGLKPPPPPWPAGISPTAR